MQTSDLPSIYVTIEILIGEAWVARQTYPLEKICVMLGRNQNLHEFNGDIRISEKICAKDVCDKVSGIHLTFYRRSSTEKEGGRYVSRLGGYSVVDGFKGQRPSTNGTLLNGKPLMEKTNLKDGDVLLIGKAIRVVYYQPQPKTLVDAFEDTLTDATDAEC